MAIKILENLLINKEEWELAPFKFNVTRLNFSEGGEPTPPTPPAPSEEGLLGKLKIGAVPIVDDNYNLADGSVLSKTNYADFVNYIAELYADNPSADYFTTEASWQTEVTTYGVCDKYVYDSVNETVRIPLYGNALDVSPVYYYIKVK